ncbi:hypothetical protein LCGC14_2628020 [marine sediment metagenome]|uniref:Uncharacterized protein n=1 Tax=marine sediment metagenome TaxID=412755 RepID=A0A0F9CC80_9ZZZZ
MSNTPEKRIEEIESLVKGIQEMFHGWYKVHDVNEQQDLMIYNATITSPLTAMLKNLRTSHHQATLEGIREEEQLRGAGKMLNCLWYNSSNVRDMSERVEKELVYYFGKNWSKYC